MNQTTVTRLRALMLAVSVGTLAMLVGSAHGSFGAGTDLQSKLDAVFEAAESAFPKRSVVEIDLNDGRSPVPARWHATFERFAQSDRASPPAAGGVVFVGSSSIAFWTDLQEQFPNIEVVQRGLGGATMVDVLHHADRLILPYRPRVIVVYAGDNDLASGVAPERIVADYVALVRQVHHELPTTRIVFVSIKPSPLRDALIPLIRRTNALMATYAGSDRQLDFVNVFDAMLDADAHARPELFLADGLHMTAPGYALWHDAIAQHLH